MVCLLEGAPKQLLQAARKMAAAHLFCLVPCATQVRTLVQREMGAALQQYDALLCPAAPTPAYRLGEKTSDPLAMYKGTYVGFTQNCGASAL